MAVNNGTVLLIDDNESILSLSRAALERDGYVVFSALTGAEGLQHMSLQKFNLVLLDLKLPDRSGVDVLSDIKANPLHQETPVVIITSSSEMSSVQECLKLGAIDYMIKPLNTNLLRHRVQENIKNDELKKAPSVNVGEAHIAVVDDDANNLKLIGARLGHLGFRYTLIEDGAAALQRLRDNDVDLVMLDINMSKLSGIQILEALRSEPKTSKLPVIMLSAEREVSVIQDCIDKGANDYIIKPYNLAILERRLKVNLARWKAGK